MKRSEALAKVRHCGYFGKHDEAIQIITKKEISAVAVCKALSDGEKLRKWGRPCNCPECSRKRRDFSNEKQ
jgi:hypothetical protein